MKKIHYILLFITVFFLGYLAKRLYQHLTYHPMDQELIDANLYNNLRVNIQEGLPIDSTSIVLVGNSLTEGFPMQELLPDLPVKNRGIGMNRTCHVLSRIGNIARHHPAYLFLEIGINDLRNHVSLDSILTNYNRIIDTIQTLSPQTRICIQALLPTCKAYDWVNKDVLMLNERLITLTNSRLLSFLDLYPLFLDGGKLDSALTQDGLHLNSEGYRLLAEQLKVYLMNDKLRIILNRKNQEAP